MNKNKVLLIIIILILIAIVIITVKNNNKSKDETKGIFENDTISSELVLEDISFTNIKKAYNEGITTITADVTNNTKKAIDANVKIIVYDENGNEVTSMIQVLENLKPEKKQLLSTGIMGNYTDNMFSVEIKLISNKEVEDYN